MSTDTGALASPPPPAPPPPQPVDAPLPPWLAHLHAQLEKHEEQGAGTRELIDDYGKLFSQALFLARTNDDLSRRRHADPAPLSAPAAAVVRARSVSSASGASPAAAAIPRSASGSIAPPTTSAAGGSGDPANADPRVDQLCDQLERTEVERNAVVQKVKSLQTQLAQQERTSRKLTNEVGRLRDAVKDLSIKLHDATHLVKTKDDTILVIQDELNVAHLELKAKEERLASLEKEHQDLLGRWLEFKAKQATRINAANEIEESALPTTVMGRAVSAKLGNTFRALGSMLGSAPAGGGGGASGTGSGSVTPTGPRSASGIDSLPPPRVSEAYAVPQRLSRTIAAHDGDILAVASSYDGGYIATGGVDNQIKLWNPLTGSQTAVLPTVFASILSLAFSPISHTLAAGSADNAVRLYRPHAPGSPTGNAPVRLVHTFTGHIGKVTGVAITGREDLVVTCSSDRTLKLWDVSKGYCSKTMFAFSACTDVGVADYAATTLVSAHLDGKLRVWDSASGNLGAEIVLSGSHGGAVVGVQVKDPNTVVTLARDHQVRVVDLRQQATVHTLQSEFFRVGTTKPGISPGGGFIAAGASDGSVFAWDLRSAEQTILTGGHGAHVNAVAWNASDGSQMYSVDKSGQLAIWAM
ncbi:hypothetical protein H9P43_003904 [Blastocladiella emersonii ATCC 22665]|nr:hypothetical protein H9P43_003904 [Blastocladiella emersonii ATCC 22665]